MDQRGCLDDVVWINEVAWMVLSGRGCLVVLKSGGVVGRSTHFTDDQGVDKEDCQRHGKVEDDCSDVVNDRHFHHVQHDGLDRLNNQRDQS